MIGYADFELRGSFSSGRLDNFTVKLCQLLLEIRYNPIEFNGNRNRATTGSYEVTALLGKGGMGEVYRALDRHLRREVALKVLPDAVASSADHIARFRREAQALASLNHPNIVRDLRHRLLRWRQRAFRRSCWSSSPVQTLRPVDRQAGPLHHERHGSRLFAITTRRRPRPAGPLERGIVHRDLKPANIKLTVGEDGRVEGCSTFGLAKLIAEAKEIEADPSESPTITSDGTLQGVLLGTPAYMSPEQARGQSLDARTDIWSFGCVLFEMLTGRGPFAASTVSDTIAKVLDREPEWQALPVQTPEAVRRVLRRCLEKDSKRRIHHVADIRIELEEALGISGAEQIRDANEPAAKRISRVWRLAAVAITLVFAITVFFVQRRTPPDRSSPREYVALTNFTDSAVQPSLSPDGRMLTFIRGNDPFTTEGEVYVKLLPNGDPVQLTHDGHDGIRKMSPKFSPDSTRIAYTKESANGWETWVVPSLGGEPRRMLANAAALTWVGNRRVLFSEMKGKGVLMGISTATEDRGDARDVYVPTADSGMAHRSYLAPNGKSVLVAEMIVAEGGWKPCRLVPYDGMSKGTQVGPAASQCIEAAWSPDGRWMYFTANAGAGYRIWRQRFPDGPVEQITSGATEEAGIAIPQDGGSIISSVGAQQSTVWVHDPSGERQISAEGYAFVPSFSSDGRKLFYLSRAGSSPVWITGELWSFDLTSGARARILPGFVMQHYDISPDNSRIVFAGSDASGRTGVWLAAIDDRFSPRLISAGESQRAFFQSSNTILFQKKEGSSWFVYIANDDGTDERKALPAPVDLFVFRFSRWPLDDRR